MDNVLYDMIHAGLLRVTSQSSPEWRFWSRVDKNGPEHPMFGKCWLWTGATTDGYGSLIIHKHVRLSHRFSWVLHNGPIKNDLCVLHHCDNPICVNPSHLFLGTNVDNQADKMSKGRQANGSKCRRSKLTDEDVRIMRAKYVPRSRLYGSSSLGREYGITKESAWAILKRKSWKHVN